MIQYPFDPLTLSPPGQVDQPEPAAFAEKIAIRAMQQEIIDADPLIFLGAETVQYGVESYTLEPGLGKIHFTVPTFELIADDLATSLHAYWGVYPSIPPLKPGDPEAYYFVGQLWPDPDHTTAPVNDATAQFYEQFLHELAAYGYEFVNSVAYEILDFFMPTDWKQRNWKQDPAQSGWVPPSSFIQPTLPAALDYVAAVQKQILTIATSKGLAPRFQIGEPWWWDGAYNTGAGRNSPTIYDPHTTALYKIETGNNVPTPYVTNIFDPLPAAQFPYIDWLRRKLGASTAYIRDSVKAAFPAAKSTLLFFTPQVLSPTSELTRRLNFPVEDWQWPNYDFVQIEDYDWIIDGRLDLLPGTIEAATVTLGYPRTVVHYFSGFILRSQDYHIWPWIDKAIRMAKESSMPYIYVWSFTQAMRDSILYNDMPPAALSLPIFDLPPNWSAAYKMTREWKTEIITSRSGREQRRALRVTPRKTAEFTTLLNAGEMRRFDAFLSTWQGFSFMMPEVTRSVATMSDLAPSAIRVQLPAAQPWMQLGDVVVLAQPGVMDARVIDRIDGNFIEFRAADANGRTWPAGTMIYPSLYGKLSDEISTRRLSDQLVEGSIVFEVEPGSEAPPWTPTVAPATFQGIELFTAQEDRSAPVSNKMVFNTEKVDYGQGRTKTFNPQMFSSLITTFSFWSRNQTEADAIQALFDRARGRQGVFWKSTGQSDLDIADAAVAGSSLLVNGQEIVLYMQQDQVRKNLVILTEDGVMHPHQITAVAAGAGDTTVLTVTPDITAAEIATAAKVSWLLLSRFATDSLITSWTTDRLSQFDLSIQSLRAAER